MRVQGHGTIIQISSVGGRVAFPMYSLYHGTKWAVEGFSESLQYELRSLGIRIKIVEPGLIKTAFYDEGRVHVPSGEEAYSIFVKKVEQLSMDAGKRGASPEVVARTILRAANDQSYRMRYSIGFPAPIILILKRILPDRWFSWLIRRTYGI